MASIHRRPGSRFWHAAFRDSRGKLQLRSTKLSDRRKALFAALEFERVERLTREDILVESQARKLVSELMERVGNGALLKVHSVEEVLNEWLSVRITGKAVRTAIRYSKVVSDFVGFLGERAKRPITTLTPKDIQGYLTARMKKDGCSATTATVDGKVLRTALNYTRRQGVISVNVAEEVDLPKGEAIERSTFSYEEIRKLIGTAEGEWKTLIMIGYFTGARLSDCCKLKWADLDLEQRIFSILMEKTKRKLVAPLHPELHTYLLQLFKTSSSEVFVMPGMAAKGPGGKHGLSEGFKRIVRRAGLDLQTVQGSGIRKISRRTFHSLRHSFTSALANAGVPQEIRMKLTGHSSQAIHRGYTHHEMETLRVALEMVG